MGNGIFSSKEVANVEIVGFQYLSVQVPHFNLINNDVTGLTVCMRFIELGVVKDCFQRFLNYIFQCFGLINRSANAQHLGRDFGSFFILLFELLLHWVLGELRHSQRVESIR